MTFQLDTNGVLSWLTAFDLEYIPKFRLFVDRRTGEAVVYFVDDDNIDANWTRTENATRRTLVRESPNSFVEIPIPNVLMHHRFFGEFLKSHPRECEPQQSIGQWAMAGTSEDSDAWEAFCGAKTLTWVRQFLNENGVPT